MIVIFAANLAALLFSFFVAGVLVGVVYSHCAGDALVEFFLDGKKALLMEYAAGVRGAKRGLKSFTRR